MSKTPGINNSIEKYEDLYHTFSKGILLQKGKVLFSLGSNGERNEMISARMFLYKNHTSCKYRSLQESRFPKVVEVFDTLKLKIPIKITTQFLSPGVKYGAYIIFKFHTYFEVLLESFSRYHCGTESIYVEGIEFRDVKNEEVEQVKETLNSDSNTDQCLSLKEVNTKKHLMLSAVEVLYESANLKHFHVHPSVKSRRLSYHDNTNFVSSAKFKVRCCHMIQFTRVTLFISFQKTVSGCTAR
uniref:Putative phloem protein 2-like protein n=1 Tax=Helianthus annuus TaxID=4232 RepID=A0A251UDI4_HELAN